MKRDFELCRRILKEAEDWDAGMGPFSVSLPGEYEQPLANEHAELLIEAGLLKGKVLRGVNGIASVAITGLTWAGHDFIESAKKESLWSRAFEIVKEKGGVMTFSVLTELLKKLANAAAGLP